MTDPKIDADDVGIEPAIEVRAVANVRIAGEDPPPVHVTTTASVMTMTNLAQGGDAATVVARTPATMNRAGNGAMSQPG